jgi:thiamine biosynthesis lipoprotein
MGTGILAMLDSERESPALLEVPTWFEEWEQALSRFRLDSELTRLNSNSCVPTQVSQTLWDVYLCALEAEALTGGLVNPLVLNALVRAGYSQSFDQRSRDSSANAFSSPFGGELTEAFTAGPLPSLTSLSSDTSAGVLCLPDGVGLDFGGVAKGWAAHKAMQRLNVAGPALVSAGGDIAVSGQQSNGEPWPIGVEDPFGSADILETIYLEDGGVATSGRDRRRWIHAGVPQHHVIDPRTSLPAQTDIFAVTVIASTVMRAEAMAKAVMISGSQTGLEGLEGTEELAGLLVLENGQRLYSRNFEKYL